MIGNAPAPRNTNVNLGSPSVWKRFGPLAPIMSSVQLLRVVVSQRLSAAAEDILEAVKKTLAGYEEEILLSKREIRQQRRVLQTLLQPEVKLNKLAGSSVSAMDVCREVSTRTSPTSTFRLKMHVYVSVLA